MQTGELSVLGPCHSMADGREHRTQLERRTWAPIQPSTSFTKMQFGSDFMARHDKGKMMISQLQSTVSPAHGHRRSTHHGAGRQDFSSVQSKEIQSLSWSYWCNCSTQVSFR